MKELFLEYIEKRLDDGFLLIACGLPVTGKTGATAEIVRLKGGRILRTDLIRLEVLKNEDVFDEEVAADMNRRLKVYDEMFRQADDTIGSVDNLILDATFVTQALRRRAAEMAAVYGKALIILESVCPREIALRRLANRSRESYESNALNEAAYANNERSFEAVDLEDLKDRYPALNITHLVVDTGYDGPEQWHVTGVVNR